MKDDQTLIDQFLRGDQRAFDQLVLNHQEKVRQFMYRATGDIDDMNDLAQEAFIKVYHNLHRFRRPSEFSTWLYRITRNVCMDHLDAESRTRERSDRMQLEIDNTPPPTPNPRVDSISEALYRLSPDKREILVLSRYEGLSYKEIAEVLQTTVGAVKVRAHRDIRELRREYEKLEQAT